MIYTTPDYYKDFHCIADQCEDTCCAGWKIVIDKESLNKYKKIRGKFKWRMLRSVNWFEKTFRQDKEKRCAFLNDNNLCDLLLAQGEESLCRTCDQYPRHTEEFEGVREITLSVSCPEVARILMERMTPVTFVSREEEGEEEFEDFDPFLFSILEDARERMIQILQNRELSIRARAILILQMAGEIQEKIDDEDMFACFDVIKSYGGEEMIDSEAESFQSQAWDKGIEDKVIKAKELAQDNDTDIREASLAGEMFARLHELELLKVDWAVLLTRTEHLLYANGTEAYSQIRGDFATWMDTHPEMEIHLEQLLVYFVFTYFPGAVYDGAAQDKVRMAVYLVWMIEELWMARWLENEGDLDIEEIVDLVYRFSREVEHSDENLHRVEEMMEELWSE